MSASSSDGQWRLPTRIAFRFFFVFLGLAYFPFPLDFVPAVGNVWLKIWTPIVVGVGRAVFGVTVDATFNGSGDKPYDWMQLFVMAASALIVTVIWSIIDCKRKSYPRLYRWFHVYVRFSLAAAMTAYGAYKVIPSQFSAPVTERLVQAFGDASPMGLLWTFMGASAPYTIFTGLGELTGGLLLTNRRTTLLGALITAAVMTHVVMLNFSYDVPVKIYSSLLLMTALFIAAPDAGRLLHFFVLDRPSEPLFARRGWRIAASVVVVLFVVYMLQQQLRSSWKQHQMIQDRFAASPVSGVWNVDELTENGMPRPPLTTDAKRPRRLVISGKMLASIQNMDDSRTRYALVIDDKRKTLTLRSRDVKMGMTLAYQTPDPRTLIVSGPFGGKKITATLHKADKPFLLTSRGFHWVNPVPFNR